MLNSVTWLRVAAVLTLIHAILHTIGGVFGAPEPGTAAMVAATMRDNHFQVFGVTRSYAEFYLGMGLGITIFLILAAVLYWQLSNIARNNAGLLPPVLILLAVSFLAFAVDSYRYFFLAPVVVETLIALCTVFALLGIRRRAIG